MEENGSWIVFRAQEAWGGLVVSYFNQTWISNVAPTLSRLQQSWTEVKSPEGLWATTVFSLEKFMHRSARSYLGPPWCTSPPPTTHILLYYVQWELSWRKATGVYMNMRIVSLCDKRLTARFSTSLKKLAHENAACLQTGRKRPLFPSV